MEEGKHISYLANLKQLSSQRINKKFISTLHPLSPLNVLLYQFLKSLTRSINFLIFFFFNQEVFWFLLSTRKEGCFKEGSKCLIAEPALPGEMAERMTMRRELVMLCTSSSQPEKSASQVWLRIQPSQVWFTYQPGKVEQTSVQLHPTLFSSFLPIHIH